MKMPVLRGLWALLLGLLLLVSGCGQKGDLYLPGDDQASRVAAPGHAMPIV